MVDVCGANAGNEVVAVKPGSRENNFPKYKK